MFTLIFNQIMFNFHLFLLFHVHFSQRKALKVFWNKKNNKNQQQNFDKTLYSDNIIELLLNISIYLMQSLAIFNSMKINRSII